MTTRRKILFSCLFAYLLLDAYQAIAVSMDYLKMFNNSHGKLTPNGQEAWNIFYSMQLAGPNNKIWMYFIIYNLFFDTCRLCIETFIFIFVI